MKKIYVVLFLILIFCALPVMSKDPVTKNFDIQGIYGTTLSLDVEPIAAQTLSYIAGMPFNILDKQVNPDQESGGRQIARWSAASNTDFTIRVSADHLKFLPKATDEGKEAEPLEYILTFKYDVSIADRVFEDRTFSITSGTGEHEFNITNDTSDLSGGFIGIIDGGIFFHFTEDGWTNAQDDTKAPDGEYHTTATIKLIGR